MSDCTVSSLSNCAGETILGLYPDKTADFKSARKSPVPTKCPHSRHHCEDFCLHGKRGSMPLVFLPAFLLSELELSLLFGFTLLTAQLLAFGFVFLLHELKRLL